MNVIRCLLVDDDIDDQELFKIFLCDLVEDVECDSAYNGKEAMARLTQATSLPDIIFLDIHMPLMDGIQFLQERQKHERLTSIPVVVTSTTLSDRDLEKAKALGVKEFFDKPSEAIEWNDKISGVFLRQLNRKL